MKFEIMVGARAVWVNADTGECIGRFGLYGVDVHRRVADQHLGECLACPHGRVTADDWRLFQTAMLDHYEIDLSHLAMPDFVGKSANLARGKNHASP